MPMYCYECGHGDGDGDTEIEKDVTIHLPRGQKTLT